MKTIEIEDDVYNFLLRNTNQIGESASQILRRLLGIQKQEDMKVEESNTELSECINSTAFKARSKAIDKFLYILSFLYDRNPGKFKKVLELSGNCRKYFALSRKELEESGRSVYPRQIPNTTFWVITNNDTPKKKRMLVDVLRLLDYSDAAVKEALVALS